MKKIFKTLLFVFFFVLPIFIFRFIFGLSNIIKMEFGNPLVEGYNWLRWSHVYLTLGSLFAVVLYIPIIRAVIKKRTKILLIPFILAILFIFFYIVFAMVLKNYNHTQNIKQFEEQLKEKYNNTIALENAAQSYEAKGDYDKAIELYTKVLNITENTAYVLHDRAMVYSKQDEYTKAIADMNEAMRMNPDETDFIAQCFNDRGVIYFHSGQYEKSWEDVKKALEMGYDVHPGFIAALKKKGYSK